jgi:putative N6-adenine-specific DNA methylase
LANLHLRTAGRVLLRLSSFAATNFRQLKKQIATIPWELYLPAGAVPACHAACRSSRLYHSQAVNQHVTEVISSQWQKLGITPFQTPEQAVFIRIAQDQVTVSLDSSGANLYRRGLKTHHSPAPLRETLAAGILALAGYDPRRPLADPMCGSGTFALEAALMAKRIPPGRFRTFPFMQWPAFRPRQWHFILSRADSKAVQYSAPHILAADRDASACRQLADCVARHQLDDAVQVQWRDFFDPSVLASTASLSGLVVLNPPYGRRLKPDNTIDGFYQAIGRQLCNGYPGWNLALVVPKARLADLLPFATQPTPLIHGGLELTLLTGTIPK